MNKTTWSIDQAHSDIAFKVKHMMISTVTGHFQDFTATATTEGDSFQNAHIEFTAKTDSINSKNADRDAHLKGEEFFNAAKYPEIKFVSKSFDGSQLVGDLTIREVTKEVSLDAEVSEVAVDPYGQSKVGIELRGEVNRKDFNLTWSAVTEAGNVVVSDKVKLVLDAQFIKQA